MDGDSGLALLRVLVSLGVIVAVLLYAKKRLGKGGRPRAQHRAVTVIGRQALGGKASVAVVEAEGRRYLLGVTEHQVTLLEAVDAPVPDFATELADAARVTTLPLRRDRIQARHVAERPRRAIAGGARPSLLDPATWQAAASSLQGRG
ncbi:FliO/MopB family protein [Herbiconiux sp. SYSU D00978]|uniref:FliO/MopB family protein n=1 Tax=Herbiconiux sp. SYSU D00978 TaxID=2812562 RepID=UPI001A97CC4B|nr:flagellar biosynthetic protein FliO [Herbiconiux sp. SYSU D00978]